MDSGRIICYCGNGRGKSAAALGFAFKAAACGKRVMIVQFMKNLSESEFVKRLEPEIKVFRFEKSDRDFITLSDEEKRDETENINTGVLFARKVLSTGECDLLILDEILGLVDAGILEESALIDMLSQKSENQTVIMTGIHFPEKLVADKVYDIEEV